MFLANLKHSLGVVAGNDDLGPENPGGPGTETTTVAGKILSPANEMSNAEYLPS